jgi:CrcB protein
MVYLWIGLGSALGGMTRYAASVGLARMLGLGFPYGTMMVNMAGSFVIGYAMGMMEEQGNPALRQFVMPGFCGGFTTFSTFSLEALLLTRDGQMGKAALYAGLTMAGCLAAVWLGHAASAKQ